MSSSPDKNLPGLHLASAGSYPRIGDAAELQLLRRASSALDRGERNTADVLDAENEMTRRAIADQLNAGLEVITDGQIRWYDPISHIASKLDNVKITGLQRYFDTNVYFRQPVFTGTPIRSGHFVAKDYSFARNALGHLPTPKHLAGKLSVKPVLTGPYTLAKFSLSASAGNGSTVHFPLSNRALSPMPDALAPEIIALAQIGAAQIQIDEPAIIKYPGRLGQFSRKPSSRSSPRAKKLRRKGAGPSLPSTFTSTIPRLFTKNSSRWTSIFSASISPTIRSSPTWSSPPALRNRSALALSTAATPSSKMPTKSRASSIAYCRKFKADAPTSAPPAVSNISRAIAPSPNSNCSPKSARP